MLVPGSVNPLLLTSAAGAAAGGISRSLRFNSADSAYLSRTPGSAGNRKTWSFSCWVKRGTIGGSYQNILSAANSVSDRYEVYFDTSTNQLTGEIRIGGTGYIITTTQVFRDPSAWYHILVVMDTSQATASNRHKFYVNGTQVTNFASASYPNQDATPQWNAADPHSIGRYQNGASQYLDGYLADIYFIDGQALDPSSFTETDATTGQLIPKAYTGSYGTNGFHLEFSDNSGTTSTTLGKDSAGSNNWTPNNFSVASGAGNDSVVDVPTNGAQTDTGVGGEVRGNYCTMNPLISGTFSNGNLDQGSTTGIKYGTLGVSTGKWYFEILLATQASGGQKAGIAKAGATGELGDDALGWAVIAQGLGNPNNGQTVHSGSTSSNWTSFVAGDIINCAFDVDSGKVWFGKNGTWFNSGNPGSGTNAIYSDLNGVIFPAASNSNGGALTWNFGQRAFAYTAPSGFKALCTANLPAPLVTKPNTVFDTVLYTGTGSTQTISSLQFNPDFLWIKNRDTAGYNHHLTDVVRGVTQRLRSNTTGAELTTTDQVTAYTSTGFTLGADSAGPGDLECNQSSKTYVAWAWDAGTTTDTNNTAGSITSSVRANATAGFSVVGFDAGAGGQVTMGHGLGVAPSLIILKRRTAAESWYVWTQGFTTSEYLILNGTNAKTTSTNLWGTSLPSSTLFGYNANSGTHIAYCFAPVVGYTSISSYTGNGSSDGVFVYTGMRPRFIMIKRTDTTSNWTIIDTAREGYNVDNDPLYPNLADAEGTTDLADILSNGFKLRSSDASVNASSGTYVYAAFAESPLNYSRAR